MCKCVFASQIIAFLCSHLFFPEWHQYDDIVCAKPSIPELIKSHILLQDKKKDIVNGKIIAANIMLENIFSILGTWSTVNLKNFFSQLKQFHWVTKEPCVYSGEKLPWDELNFGEQQVICLLLTDARKEKVGYRALFLLLTLLELIFCFSNQKAHVTEPAGILSWCLPLSTLGAFC